MPESYCMILTTTADRQEAEKLARLLLEQRLAACIQVIPITSYYVWKDQPRDDAEFLLLIKTVDRRYADVEAAIRKNHSYEVPEIVQLPIERGLDRYFAWISENTA